MKIRTIGGLIGALELMRGYQRETTENGRIMAGKWQKEIDEFTAAWKKDGVNGSTPLFSEKEGYGHGSGKGKEAAVLPL
jgi:hypothetical protein